MILGYPLWGWVLGIVLVVAFGLAGRDRLRKVAISMRAGSVKRGAVGRTVYKREEPSRFWFFVTLNGLVGLFCVMLCAFMLVNCFVTIIFKAPL